MTKEMDYALRIMDCLASNYDAEKGVNTATISELTTVPQRFALKILHKLTQSGLVCSYKGAGGGYALSRPCREITLLSIIESVDGPITINDCLDEGCECSRSNYDKKRCFYHHILDDINATISKKLGAITLEDALESSK